METELTAERFPLGGWAHHESSGFLKRCRALIEGRGGGFLQEAVQATLLDKCHKDHPCQSSALASEALRWALEGG